MLLRLRGQLLPFIGLKFAAAGLKIAAAVAPQKLPLLQCRAACVHGASPDLAAVLTARRDACQAVPGQGGVTGRTHGAGNGGRSGSGGHEHGAAVWAGAGPCGCCRPRQETQALAPRLLTWLQRVCCCMGGSAQPCMPRPLQPSGSDCSHSGLCSASHPSFALFHVFG